MASSKRTCIWVAAVLLTLGSVDMAQAGMVLSSSTIDQPSAAEFSNQSSSDNATNIDFYLTTQRSKGLGCDLLPTPGGRKKQLGLVTHSDVETRTGMDAVLTVPTRSPPSRHRGRLFRPPRRPS